MHRRFRRVLPFLLLATSLYAIPQDQQRPAPAAPGQPAPPAQGLPADLAEASTALRSGQFTAAEAKYRAILANVPDSTLAQAGLVRSLLKQEKVQDAYELGTKYLAASANDPNLHTAMGEVHFRRAEMVEAEIDFRTALKFYPRDVRAHLGLAEILDSIALHRKSYDQLLAARDIAPDDPEVQLEWVGFLPRSSRISAIEAYLSAPHEGNQEQNGEIVEYLNFLKNSSADKKAHPCRLTKAVERTQTELVPLMVDAQHLRGWGVKVKMNDHVAKLLLDTGASGLYISRRQAEKSGVVRISQDHATGIGDQGPAGGYYGYVDHLQIGELQFEDCIIEVSDKRSITDEDGLIGADVFSDYVVNIEFREQRIRLEPLPKRPGEEDKPKSLNTEGDDSAVAPGGTEASAESKTAPEDAVDIHTFVPKRLPQDRYIAPEMTNWSKVFRFGHMLLIPTRVNDLNNRLFLIDTGAFNTTFGMNLAKELGKTSFSSDYEIHGVSGKVAKVYTAKNADLIFGHLKQRIEDAVTFDISNLSRGIGTEVSGIVGFAVLNLMDLQIDYRDNLVNLNYDPTKIGLPTFDKKKQ